MRSDSFDKDGIIKPDTIQNRIKKTMAQTVNPGIKKKILALKKYFGKPRLLAEIDEAFIPLVL